MLRGSDLREPNRELATPGAFSTQKKFVIAFASSNCYESACCGWLSSAKPRAMPELLRHEKIGSHH
jgi:hypothetical protein